MIIGLVQLDIVWGDRAENQRSVEHFIAENLASAQLVLLPEMFATGYSMKPDKIAEPADSSLTLQWMCSMAVKYGKAIVGSVAISENDRYYNRMYFVKDNGTYEYVDKRHLFRMAGEDKVYSPGRERLIVNYGGVRFLPLVCYDLRFPVWSRMQGEEYDVILYVASWPTVRNYAWDTLLRARAIENLSYVCAVNRVGSDKANGYSGHSVVLDYKGRALAECENDKACAISVELDLSKQNKYRDSFPAYKDSDVFSIEY